MPAPAKEIEGPKRDMTSAKEREAQKELGGKRSHTMDELLLIHDWIKTLGGRESVTSGEIQAIYRDLNTIRELIDEQERYGQEHYIDDVWMADIEAGRTNALRDAYEKMIDRVAKTVTEYILKELNSAHKLIEGLEKQDELAAKDIEQAMLASRNINTLIDDLTQQEGASLIDILRQKCDELENRIGEMVTSKEDQYRKAER